MSTLRCFCRWGQKKDEKTSHVCTSRRPPRNWSEISKGSQASGQQSQKSAAAAEKAKSKWNCRAQLNSRFGLGFMLSFEPLPPPQIHQRDSPMREHLGVFAIPRMLCSSNASLATFLAFLTRFLNLILILFYFGLFSIVYLLFSISAGRLFTIRRWQRWKPCSSSFLIFSQVSWKLGSCNEEKRPTFAQN